MWGLLSTRVYHQPLCHKKLITLVKLITASEDQVTPFYDRLIDVVLNFFWIFIRGQEAPQVHPTKSSRILFHGLTFNPDTLTRNQTMSKRKDASASADRAALLV